MKADALQSIVVGAEIPSVPHVLQELLQRTHDPRTSSRDLARLVQQEPGLATHLLRMVNSALYGLRQKVSSVAHAVVLLGFGTVRSTAAGLALVDAFSDLPGFDQAYVLSVWEHALARAGLVKALTPASLRARQDDLFLAGMIQDVGHLVLARKFQQEYAGLCAAHALPPIGEEEARFGVNHAEVGACLLQEWGFPEKVIALVAGHHDPDNTAPGAEYLVACDRLSAARFDLEGILGLDETEVDADLVDCLREGGISWADLQAAEASISEAVALAKQVTGEH